MYATVPTIARSVPTCVEDHDSTVRRHQHIGRLDVAVQLARAVQETNALGKLPQGEPQALVLLGTKRARVHGECIVCAERVGILTRIGVIQRFADLAVRAGGVRCATGLMGGRRAGTHVFEEAVAFDVLHREEPLVGARDELVEGDQVGMHDVGERSELLLEAVQRHGVDARQGLERHARIPLAVVGLIDDTHAAGPDLTDNPIAFRAAEIRHILLAHARRFRGRQWFSSALCARGPQDASEKP